QARAPDSPRASDGGLPDPVDGRNLLFLDPPRCGAWNSNRPAAGDRARSRFPACRDAETATSPDHQGDLPRPGPRGAAAQVARYHVTLISILLQQWGANENCFARKAEVRFEYIRSADDQDVGASATQTFLGAMPMDEGENERGLTGDGHQNLIAQ